MVTLEVLPNELAIQCAAYLSQKNLRQVALVYLQLHPIAEETLYHLPVLQNCFINLCYNKTMSCLAIFAHTLLRRPDLVRKICTLTIVTSRENYPTFIKFYKDDQASFFSTLSKYPSRIVEALLKRHKHMPLHVLGNGSYSKLSGFSLGDSPVHHLLLLVSILVVALLMTVMHSNGQVSSFSSRLGKASVNIAR
jgi:hypothetical protein